jgi:hypothetical protein
MNERKMICKPIGVAVIGKGDAWSTESCAIRVVSESGVDEGAFYPAQDVHIYGKLQVQALRDLCNETLKLMEDFK